jgi:hypothetical protein
MANVDSPFGLRPVRYLNGAPWNGQVRRYLIPSSDGTAVFIGDPVKPGGSAGAAGLMVDGVPAYGLQDVVQAAAGDPVLGVVVGFEPIKSNLETKHRLASTARIAYVCDDPNVVFEIQEVSGGTALAATEVGLNVNFVVGSGNTTTGLSGVELNNSGEATTATLNCRILGLVQREDNDYGEHAKWEVLLMAHSFRAGVAGV